MFKLTLSFKGRLLKACRLPDGDTFIGRDPQCGMHIDSLAISPQHARIHVQGTLATLHDLGTADGVLVNRQKVSSHTLSDGDEIQVGKHTLTISIDNAAAALQQQDDASGRPSSVASARIGWLQVLSGPHLGRTFPIEHDPHRIGTTGTPSACIVRRDEAYFLTSVDGDPPCHIDGLVPDSAGQLLSDGAIIDCGELRLQFFMDQAVSLATAQKPAPAGASLRHFTRIRFEAQTRLFNDQAEWRSQLIDVSLRGALIERPENWQGTIGDRFDLGITLDDGTLINMAVSVAHVRADRIGLYCDHIDIDSITHLRRLVELNLGNPESLERELAGLG